MTNKDLERLLEILGDTGFEIKENSDGRAWITFKDPWEGVEFVDCVDGDGSLISPRKIYKALNNLPGEPSINIRIVDNKLVELSINKKWFKPSTEEAYVNQLKAKAFELYGEIQKGDVFGYYVNTNFEIENTVLKYENKIDALCAGNWIIYLKGEWAKKIPKRIEVNFDRGNVYSRIFYFNYSNETIEKMMNIGSSKIGEFLAKQLEKYLNDEVD
jgi:hypothetical protein